MRASHNMDTQSLQEGIYESIRHTTSNSGIKTFGDDD